MKIKDNKLENKKLEKEEEKNLSKRNFYENPSNRQSELAIKDKIKQREQESEKATKNYYRFQNNEKEKLIKKNENENYFFLNKDYVLEKARMKNEQRQKVYEEVVRQPKDTNDKYSNYFEKEFYK